MSAITLGKNFEPSNLTFSEGKAVGKQGAKIVYVSNNGRPIILQTPEMPCPFGLSKFAAEAKGSADKYSIGLSFKNREFNVAMNKFFTAMTKFDDEMIDAAMKNSMAWFKTKYSSREVVQALYTPVVKFAKDKQTMEITDKYPPTLRLNLPYKDGKIMVDCFDDDRNPVELTDSMDLKGAKVTAIIQCAGVWLVGGKCTPTWKVLQLKVSQSSSGIKGFAFKDDDEDAANGDVLEDGDDVDLEQMPKAAAPKPAPAPPTSPQVNDLLPESDEEEEEDELEKPKPVKKSLVVKKKVAA